MPASAPSEPHPGLTAARAARAAAPRADAASLRRAYLELLKLCLCDLTGSTSASVGRTHGDAISVRELSGEGLRLRAAGMDWPLQGLTMVGLGRLDDLQSCVETVVADGVPGDLIEAGAWRGGASILMRTTLDTLGEPGRSVVVADSFQGFPTLAGDSDQWDAMDFLEVPVDEVRANFGRFGLDAGVEFVEGFFEDTMPVLAGQGRRWALVRLDGDTYEATWLTLQSLYPTLAPGGYLVVDDYGALDECRRAVDEFRAHHRIEEPLEQADWTGVRWRRRSDAPLAADGTPPVPAQQAARRRAHPVARPERRPIPTAAEIELRQRVAELEARLAGAEAELAELRGSPLKAPRDWLRARVGRGGAQR